MRIALPEVSTLSELVETLVRDHDTYEQTDMSAVALYSVTHEVFEFQLLPGWMKVLDDAGTPYQVVVPACYVKINNGAVEDARYVRLTPDSSVIELLQDEGGMRILYISAYIDRVITG